MTRVTPSKTADVLMADTRRWRLQRTDGRLVIVNSSHCAGLELEALPA